MLTLLLAASIGCGIPDAKFVAVVAVHVEDVRAATTKAAEKPVLTVRDIPFYFNGSIPLFPPSVPRVVTYDLRLPIFRTKP